MRRKPRQDRVSHELWNDVVHRDAYLIWRATDGDTPFNVWYKAMRVVCVPRFLDPTIGLCSGGQTVDHVREFAAMGKRAPSDHQHLVAACYFHNVLRPPTKLVRYRERQWLKRIYHAEAVARSAVAK